MILDCDRIWTALVGATYRLRGKPRVTNDPPAIVIADRRPRVERR